MAPLNIAQVVMSGSIQGLTSSQKLVLNPERTEFIERMQKGQSLSEIVQGFLESKRLPSFQNLTETVVFLVREKLIRNSSFHEYFKALLPPPLQSTSLFEDLSEKLFGKSAEGPLDIETAAKDVPFLRSIDSSVRQALLKNSRLIETPAGVVICQAGQLQRSLFVLLKGQASVYKKNSRGEARKIATLNENAVFGEAGFFLNEARTANVVTDSPCQVLKIKFVPEIYENIIQTDKARQLQKRFWLVHAMLKAPLFREIPDDCFDTLIFSGEVKTLPPQTQICREGEAGTTFYIVVQGSLVVSQAGHSIRILTQGDSFGEIALMMTGGKRTASVQAQSEVILLEISSHRFYDLLSHNLLLAQELERVALARLKSGS